MRKRTDDFPALGMVMVAMVFVASVALGAQETDPDVSVITGQLVDQMCYQRMDDEALGARHAECALKCATSGIDLVILSAAGPYIVTGPAARTEEILAFVGKHVQATGQLDETDDGLTIAVEYRELEVEEEEEESPPAEPSTELMMEEVEPPAPR